MSYTLICGAQRRQFYLRSTAELYQLIYGGHIIG